MPTKPDTTVPPTQEFLATMAAQPAQPWWKRLLNRLFAPEASWHRSRTGVGYSATWTTVSSDGSVSQANRKVSRAPTDGASAEFLAAQNSEGREIPNTAKSLTAELPTARKSARRSRRSGFRRSGFSALRNPAPFGISRASEFSAVGSRCSPLLTPQLREGCTNRVLHPI